MNKGAPVPSPIPYIPCFLSHLKSYYPYPPHQAFSPIPFLLPYPPDPFSALLNFSCPNTSHHALSPIFSLLPFPLHLSLLSRISSFRAKSWRTQGEPSPIQRCPPVHFHTDTTLDIHYRLRSTHMLIIPKGENQ